jgi:large subunit ribosomal protein L6
MAVLVEYKDDILMPEGVTSSKEEDTLVIKGPLGENRREFKHYKLAMNVETGKVQIFVRLPSIKEKALCGTWSSHVRNMLKGAVEGFEYELKVVYAHFPIKTSLKGDIFFIENFLGERFPRTARIMPNVKIKTKGDQVLVSGINKEYVGQTAVNIELATKIKGYDPRVFQDGIYIVKKG